MTTNTATQRWNTSPSSPMPWQAATSKEWERRAKAATGRNRRPDVSPVVNGAQARRLPHVAELAHDSLAEWERTGDTTHSFAFHRGETALNVLSMTDDGLMAVIRALRGSHVVAVNFEIPFSDWDLTPWSITMLPSTTSIRSPIATTV